MNKYLSILIRLTVLIILMLGTLLTLPFSSNSKQVTYAEYGEGASCNAGGHAGVCWDRVSHACGTYYDSGNYCPGDNSVQCCVNSQVHCSTFTSSYCHNASPAGFGNQYDCASVGGSFNSGGYCPGPWDVQCCVVSQQPPPTSVNASCNASGTTATVNWTLPSGYSWAYPRLYDETTGATYYPSQMTGTSYSISSTPGHQYSYWVHTTNSIGEPWSSEVPTARTAKFTCSLPACPADPTPVGSIISTGVSVSASSVLNNDTTNYGPANAVDGQLDLSHYWNSGRGPTGWIELNLGAPQTVTGLKLYVRQTPNGSTNTQILTGPVPNPGSVQRTLSCATSDNQVINISFPAPLTNVQYIRINTTVSPSSIAWNEISVYGSSPGSQTTTPGIIFSGDGSATFGQGAASVNNWVVGGLTYSEVYKVNRTETPATANIKALTSYKYVLDRATLSQATITDLATVCTLSNCTLPSTLQNGVYKANTNVNLNTFAFQPNKNYIFLINGDLTIRGSIIVPNGSTAFFTSSHDIIVDKSVGTATNLFPLPAGQLQGIYSADRDFRIEGNNDCLVGKDKMLNMEGSIVTNALGNGGNFRWQRDLCGDNPRYPTLTLRARIDMILNLPEFLMPRLTTFREDAP